ncbi:uncharacterized protein LOC129571875 [Sitodiplosis mosellana]|uniref:uncharacterized protein LOC129571875 n=1 Tax=Sitodiplosis mosellana TaxID=263140 RepID=UPI0024450B8C|nr:uncharacterized protein LOC129571875 [Sitodiplosis mosellana]
MKFKEFRDNAKKLEAVLDLKTINQFEDAFWQSWESQDLKIEKLYATDNKGSWFSDDCNMWNLGKFSSNESLIHGEKEMDGINTPYFYMGGPLTAFGLHLEDGDLNSVNYNHTGAPKIWYIIPEEYNDALEKLVQQFCGDKYTDCSKYIRHKCVLIPPSILEENAIGFTRIIQYPGQYVITLSGGYHQGFNAGFNLAEAVNFGSNRWIQFLPKFENCSCDSQENQDNIYTVARLREIVAALDSHQIVKSEIQQASELETESMYLNANFECEYCDRSYASQKSLAKHIRLLHSNTRMIYKCSTCGTKCSEVTTILAHYKSKHKKIIDKKDAAKLGSSVTNSFVPRTVPKVPTQTVYCTCGSVFTSGISSFYKHVRIYHQSTTYRDYRLEKDEPMSMNDCALPMHMENSETSSKSNQNVMEPDEGRPFSVFEIHSNDVKEECIAKTRSKRSADPTMVGPTKRSRYEPTNTLRESEGTDTQTIRTSFPSESCTMYQYKIDRPEDILNIPVVESIHEEIAGQSTIDFAMEHIGDLSNIAQVQDNVSVMLNDESNSMDRSMFGSELEIAPIQLLISSAEREASDTLISQERVMNEMIYSDFGVMNYDMFDSAVHNRGYDMHGESDEENLGSVYLEAVQMTAFDEQDIQSIFDDSSNSPASSSALIKLYDPLPESEVKSFIPEEQGRRVTNIENGNNLSDIQVRSIATGVENKIRKLSKFKIPKKSSTLVNEKLSHENLAECATSSYRGNDTPFDIKKMNRIPKKVTAPKDFGTLKMTKMEFYDIPDLIEHLEFSKTGKADFDEYKTDLEKNMRTDVDSYVNAFTTMLLMEEVTSSKDARKFDMKKVKLLRDTSSDSPNSYKIKYESTMPNYKRAVEMKIVDSFILKSPDMPGFLSGKVVGCDNRHINVQLSHSMGNDDASNECNLKFYGNRLPFQIQHEALKYIEKHKLFPQLIAESRYANDESELSASLHFDLKFRSPVANNLNNEQKMAIRAIVDKTNFPRPFLLYGPPGTGKTTTMVASIAEIVLFSDKCVLVCSQSNSACDDIAKKLMVHLDNKQILRMYASSYNIEKMDPKIASISNNINSRLEYPCLEKLYSYRVVICTLSTAGCITRSRGLDMHFNSKHFSHIYIDEAGFVNEMTSMIPIAGLCTDENGIINSSIVLVGDWNQLDAVVLSQNATALGMKTSFMEYLSKQPLYGRNSESMFNPLYIVQLTRNHRNHPEILSISDHLFYNRTLKAEAPKGKTDWFIGTDFLVNKNFPIVFRSVNGTCVKSGSSYINQDEVDAVIFCLDELFKRKWKDQSVTLEDIAIITPYSAQNKLIESQTSHFGKLSIKCPESYQGQESNIVIVSTVRTDSLGFLRDKKKFNVIMTRPIALLIIIGNHMALSKEDHWRAVINLCLEKKSITRNGHILHPRISL